MCHTLDLGAEKGKQIYTKFSENIESLVKVGIIHFTDKSYWDITRKRRNFASHLDSQSIMTPGITIDLLSSTTVHLNSLDRRRIMGIASNALKLRL